LAKRREIETRTWSSHSADNKDSSLPGRYAVCNVQEKFCWDSLDPEDIGDRFLRNGSKCLPIVPVLHT